MGVKLVSSGGGSVEINPPATASNFVATMPAATGNVVVDSATQTLTNKAWSSPAGSTITSATAVTASGTSVDFTGIPAWVKRITVMFSGVSTNGTSFPQLQIGSGSVTTSGYAGGYSRGTTAASPTSGLVVQAAAAAASAYYGVIVFVNVTGNTWVGSGNTITNASDAATLSNCTLTLGGTLDRVRITTVNGTDTFDAGSINILYE
jgi:hypothetical protein